MFQWSRSSTDPNRPGARAHELGLVARRVVAIDRAGRMPRRASTWAGETTAKLSWLAETHIETPAESERCEDMYETLLDIVALQVAVGASLVGGSAANWLASIDWIAWRGRWRATADGGRPLQRLRTTEVWNYSVARSIENVGSFFAPDLIGKPVSPERITWAILVVGPLSLESARSIRP